MLHRCKKCSYILQAASVGGGEIANLEPCHFSISALPPEVTSEMLLHFSYQWTIGKRYIQIFKHGLFIELSPRTSWRTCEGQRLDLLLDTIANTQSFKKLNVLF